MSLKDDSPHRTVRVLFVCTGNICRSPTAEGVFRHLVKEAGLEEHFKIDSCGTTAYHVGEAPDQRAQDEAFGRGVNLSSLKSRSLSSADFSSFDYILAMDEGHLNAIEARAPAHYHGVLSLLMAYVDGPSTNSSIEDPYYGGAKGFRKVFDQIEAGCSGLLRSIKKKEGWL